MTSQSKLLLKIAAASMLLCLPAAAGGLTPREKRIQLIVSGSQDYAFGSLQRFVRHMKAIGQICDPDTYARGIDIACHTPDHEPMVYLHFTYEPGPNPGLAFLDGVRANGRNGGEMPKEQFLSFWTTFTRLPLKRVNI